MWKKQLLTFLILTAAVILKQTSMLAASTGSWLQALTEAVSTTGPFSYDALGLTTHVVLIFGASGILVGILDRNLELFIHTSVLASLLLVALVADREFTYNQNGPNSLNAISVGYKEGFTFGKKIITKIGTDQYTLIRTEGLERTFGIKSCTEMTDPAVCEAWSTGFHVAIRGITQ